MKRTVRLTPADYTIAVIDSWDAAFRALAPLSPRQRAAFVLTELLGFSSEESEARGRNDERWSR